MWSAPSMISSVTSSLALAVAAFSDTQQVDGRVIAAAHQQQRTGIRSEVRQR